ncbi:MAG: macro domain-containing protein [Candidatus Paceibacterota bacterium]
MIKIVNGNILRAKEDIIGHQVNCLGKMGAGLAKQIRAKYPKVYQEYKDICRKRKPEDLLSLTQFVNVEDKTIVNIFSQLNYGTQSIQTDYVALEKCLYSILHNVTVSYCKLYNKSIALPYGIGCGLAGGDWDKVYKMIDEVFKDYEITLYKL